MKKIFLLLIVNCSLLIVNCKCFSQGAAINTTGAPADNSAILDVSATGKGILIPRMSTDNRPLNPVESLIIYNTTTQCFEAYNAATSQWVNIACIGACNVPAAPLAATNVPSVSQIVWNWNPVSGATGYKWNTVNDYALATDNGTGNSYTQTGLVCGTSYALYVWAYNSCGKSTPLTLTQATSQCFICGTAKVTDIDGNSYNTVSIGAQCWFKENLKTTKYSDNSAITNEIVDVGWAGNTEGAYCWYNNTPGAYGALYNWYAVNTGNLCPSGWHVPADAEWYTLENFVDPTINDPNATGFRGTDGGNKLKKSTGWQSPSAGTNTSGFTALPGGFRAIDGTFDYVGSGGGWWSSSAGTTGAWGRGLDYNYSGIGRGDDTKEYGMSVRCLQD